MMTTVFLFLAAQAIQPGITADGCPDLETLQGRLLFDSGESCPRFEKDKRIEKAKVSKAIAQDARIENTPLPITAQTAVKHYFDLKLMDGVSARYIWPARKTANWYCGFVNAKNMMGAYTGWRQFSVSFTETGAIDRIQVIDEDRRDSNAILCDAFKYPREPQ